MNPRLNKYFSHVAATLASRGHHRGIHSTRPVTVTPIQRARARAAAGTTIPPRGRHTA